MARGDPDVPRPVAGRPAGARPNHLRPYRRPRDRFLGRRSSRAPRSPSSTKAPASPARSSPTKTGLFTATNLPVGIYSITAELQGFRRQQKTGVNLTADGRITSDFALGVGELTESVEVTASVGETVNRTSGEVARTIDSQQIKDLAFNGRNYLELASLIPGAVATDFDPLALATSLSVTGQSINGNRGNTNNLTIDGTSNIDSGSNGSQINNVSLSFIDQVKIQTSNFSAEVGRNSGAAVNVVTRSGTNQLPRHRALRHPRREVRLAQLLRADRRRRQADQAAPRVPQLRGRASAARSSRTSCSSSAASSTARSTASPARRCETLPTTAELNGDFSFRLRGADGIVGTADDGVLRDPVTGQQFPGNVIPQNRITTDGRAMANIYRAMQGKAAVVHRHADGQQHDVRRSTTRSSRGRTSSASTGRPPTKQRIYGRYIHDEYNLTEPFGTFSGAALPTVPTDRSRPGTSYQVGPHLRRQHEPDQRSQDRRVVERPAHQAGGRLLAARHVRLPVSGTVRHARLRRRAASRTPRCPGFARDHRTELRAAVADDRHHRRRTR